jgi:hypothetical protein
MRRPPVIPSFPTRPKGIDRNDSDQIKHHQPYWDGEKSLCYLPAGLIPLAASLDSLDPVPKIMESISKTHHLIVSGKVPHRATYFHMFRPLR